MATNRLPFPQEMMHQVPENTWWEVRGQLSEPTQQTGDWRAFPHLASKDSWKKVMQPRAGEMQSLMEHFGVHYPSCPVCTADGRGNVGDFTDHIIGQNHFKALGRVCLLDNKPIAELRNQLWDTFRLPGGGIRINHADGAIEMCHGCPAVIPLTIPSLSMQLAIADRNAAAQQQVAPMVPVHRPPMVPSMAHFPFMDAGYDAIDLQPAWVQNGTNIVPPIPHDGAWYRIAHRAAWPHSDSGGASAYPHLQSKSTWKQHMQRSAQVMGLILEHFGLYPECTVCNVQLTSFHEHVPAQKHYKQLGELFLDRGASLEALRNTAWQEWKNLGVDKLNFRFNHIDGETHARVGQPQGRVQQSVNQQIQHHAFAPPAPPPPPPTDELRPGVRGLQMWLWHNQIGRAADQVAAAAEARQVPPSKLLCAVCVITNARVHMQEGVREHLKSKQHLENLEKRVLKMMPSFSGFDPPCLEQAFPKLGLTLDHLTGVVTMHHT
mmetsp:Transcript_70540/g.131964  ORF Transcript_70540/g.131964 Transcript_70540/m.131964 type:complete len:491 (+) Transcript_70540:57-1529(+)